MIHGINLYYYNLGSCTQSSPLRLRPQGPTLGLHRPNKVTRNVVKGKTFKWRCTILNILVECPCVATDSLIVFLYAINHKTYKVASFTLLSWQPLGFRFFTNELPSHQPTNISLWTTVIVVVFNPSYKYPTILYNIFARFKIPGWDYYYRLNLFTHLIYERQPFIKQIKELAIREDLWKYIIITWLRGFIQ